MNAKDFFKPRRSEPADTGAQSQQRTGEKRRRDFDESEGLEPREGSGGNSGRVEDTNQAIYGASSFGGWGEYVRRKRAKLQIQNAEIAGQAKSDAPGIFHKLQIHVTLTLRQSRYTH